MTRLPIQPISAFVIFIQNTPNLPTDVPWGSPASSVSRFFFLFNLKVIKIIGSSYQSNSGQFQPSQAHVSALTLLLPWNSVVQECC